MNKSPKLLLLVFFLFTLNSYGQEPDSLRIALKIGLEEQIDSIINNAINNDAFPGCVVYAAKQDSILFFKSYGYHTYDSINPVKKDDIYDLASITKIVGATLALMKLYEDSLIHLDNRISEYVDGLRGQVGKVTIRQALAHQGGLYPWIPYYKEVRWDNGLFHRKDISTTQNEEYKYSISDSLFLSEDFYKRIKKFIRKSDVIKNPEYRYSGLFFYLVPEIVEKLSGKSFKTYLRENFFDPLSLETMTFNPLEKFPISRIVPTEIDTFFRMQPIHGKVHDEGAIMMKGISGNAGLFSKAADLARLMRMLENYGNMDSISYLLPQTVDLFTTTHYPNLSNRRGLGFDKPLLEYDSIRSSVAKDASFRSFGHTGYTGTLAWTDPENGLTYIFLSNRVYPFRSNTALYRLNVRPTIHQMFYDYLNESSKPVENTK